MECASTKKLNEVTELRVYKYDLGLCFEFMNLSEEKIFLGKFDFKLINAEFEDMQSSFKITLSPKETVYRWANFIDLVGAIMNYEFSYAHKMYLQKIPAELVINELKKSAQKLSIADGRVTIYYNIVECHYCLLAENNTEKDANIVIAYKVVENIENCEAGQKWEITLESKKYQLNIMKLKDPFEACKFSFSVSFSQ